jgi:DNA polymerase-3 subunit alpha
MRFQTNEFYFRSPDEMKETFKDCPEAVKNSLEVASRCNLELNFKELHLPKYTPPGGKTKEIFFLELCEEGLKKRGLQDSQEARSRLEHEFKIIKHMGFVSYFLIVWDFIFPRGKSQGIPGRPRRGSASRKLVSYLMGIHQTLSRLNTGCSSKDSSNPERVSMPEYRYGLWYERRQE